MKKSLILFFIIFACLNTSAQEKKMDELVYDFLGKYDIKEYPDSVLIVARGGCWHDTCAFGFYFDINFTDIERSIQDSIEEKQYLYSLRNGKKVLVRFISQKGDKWKNYFNLEKLIVVSAEQIREQFKHYYSYYNTSDKYLRQRNETSYISLGDKIFWELAPKWITISEEEIK